jgi:hypothetical protein
MKTDSSRPENPEARSGARPGALFLLASLFLLAAGAAIRLSGIGADPPRDLSWSHAPFTDGAVVVHDARNKALFGEWILDGCRDLSLFPLSNAAAWAVFEAAGVGRAQAALPNVLFALLSAVAVTGGLAVCAGREAAFLWLLLASLNYMIMFQRLPVAEPAMLFLLSLSFLFFALSPGRRWPPYLSGFFAIAAPLFGKAHAIYFPFALLAAVLLARLPRGRPGLPLRPFLVGGAFALLLWFAVLFPFHGDYILAHWFMESVDKHAGGLIGALLEFPVNFFHMGVHTELVRRLSLALALVFLGLLGFVTEERNRFRDSEPGALLLFFWAAFGWALVAAVHQPAPRYLFPLVTPLLYFATRPLLRLWEGRDFFLRLPRGLPRSLLGGGILVLGLYQLFGAFGGRLLDFLGRSGSGRLVYDFFVRRHVYMEIVPFLFAGTAVLASVAFALLYVFRARFPLRVPLSPARGKASAAFLVVAVLALNIAPWAAWRAHATHCLRDASRDIGDWLGPGARLMGPYAPALGLDNRVRVIPYTGAPGEADAYRKYGVTHVVTASPADDAMILERDPGIHGALEMVLYYPIHTKYSDRMVVYRVPGSSSGEPIHAYRPGPFERGMEALKKDDPEEALRLFREFAEERPGNADGRYMMAVVLDRLGRTAEAAEKAHEAAALRPERGLYLQKLGAIEARRGRVDEARRALAEALRVGGDDANTRALLERLGGGGAR